MSKLKFELFITYGEKQLTIVVGDKPVLFGAGANCDVKIGEGEPKVKAMVQKEGEHLNVKIFDIKHPVSINGKKYKSAKIKKSVFFKIGDIDIISNVEEVDSDQQILHDLPESMDPPSLPSFRDTGITNPAKEASDMPAMPQTMPEVPPTASFEEKAAELEAKVSNIAKATEAQVESAPKPQAITSLEENHHIKGVFQEDGFKFNISFNDTLKNISCQKYSEKNWDYSDYIELWDESVKRLPIPEIHKPEGSKSIHVVHMNNGAVLNEDFFSAKSKRIFMTSQKGSKSYMQIHDCNSKKLEFIFGRGDATFISKVDGYDLSRAMGEKILDVSEQSVQLVEGQRVVLTKGTSQVIIQYSTTPPKIKTNRFFNVEEDLLKSVALCWSFVLFFIGSALLYDPIEEQKKEKEKVVILVRQQKKKLEKKPEKKPEKKQQKVAKAQSSKAPDKVKPQKTPPKAAQKQPKVAKVKPPKPVTKPKVKQAAPVKKPKTKIAATKKASPKKSKRKTVSKNAKRVASKEAPKKQYKFNFGKSLSATKTGVSTSNLKVAKSQGNFRNIADSVSSSTSLGGSVSNSNKFGQTNTKVARFAAGGKVGLGKNFGTKGLSGKSRSVTAYVAANTKILGAIDPALIRKLMREFIPEFRRCYQRELLKNPSVAGVFDLAFQINAKGKGIRVKVKSKGKGFSSKGRTCIKRVVSLIKFPKPKGGGLVDVKQPMNFYNQ